MHSIAEAARSRSNTMAAATRTRIKARALRLISKPTHTHSPSHNEHQVKTRALIAAIRAHTNSDIYMDINMSPPELFRSAMECLSDVSSYGNPEESKFVGEALQLVSALNILLQNR